MKNLKKLKANESEVPFFWPTPYCHLFSHRARVVADKFGKEDRRGHSRLVHS